ncbi:hypothetical protein NUH87_28750 [Pseudomonas batumici]
MPTLNLVVALVVLLMGTGVLAQQVVEQFAARRILVQRSAGFYSLVIEQVLAGSKAKVSTPKRLVALNSRPAG